MTDLAGERGMPQPSFPKWRWEASTRTVRALAALEATALSSPRSPANVGTASHAPAGAPGRAAWEATLAFRAGVESLPPIDSQADRLRADLATITAERDALQVECAYLHAARERTARMVRGERQRQRSRVDSAIGDRDAARAALATVERDSARLRTLAPLAGIKWSGGHFGASVTPKTPTRVWAPAPRLIIADGHRVAA